MLFSEKIEKIPRNSSAVIFLDFYVFKGKSLSLSKQCHFEIKDLFILGLFKLCIEF
jgi:hypothetical protein